MGLDNQYHTMGGADFHIAMTDMLLAGFPVAGNTGQRVPGAARGPGRVRPAGRRSAPATATPPRPRCSRRSTAWCGARTAAATRCAAAPNPAFRGLMTWSINWDRYYNWEFKNNHEPFLNALP